ncbi:MAG TPA: DNA translocase FtsK [Candidatus Paceibacterota bacterium]|nr:DNA translocase FtsK [Candidatus Paceibacterota bacterium]
MARKQAKKNGFSINPIAALPDGTRRAILAVIFVLVGVFLTLAAFDGAGVAGSDVYAFVANLLGVGYFLSPVLCFVIAATVLKQEEGGGLPILKIIASLLFFVSGLGFVTVVSGKGGLVGSNIADPLVHLFDVYATVSVLGGLALISLLILVEGTISIEPLRALWNLIMKLFKKGDAPAREALVTGADMGSDETPALAARHEEAGPEPYREEMPAIAKASPAQAAAAAREANAAALQTLLGEYQPPPLSLLERDKGRPGVGDIKGNANIIKRTLQNFGITVELDEISIGPSVTRYAIKPAEGVRLQKIVSLQTNLELALAAHPVRIEAPIPGKSLVGIEVPNSAKVTVGLGTLLESPEFAQSRKPLMAALGRDIAGASHFANIAKMPHALIAGATGSGKSVTIHAVINSLLFRLGPSRLRFLMIDPKRVELTLYNPIPHLLSPVITDAKRAITALRWAGKEMERRYNILEENRVRDIDSYHENVLAPALEALRKKGGTPDEGEKVPEGMPYIVIVIDELADIMQTYPRELEASIVRLAQMSRAVGIHLLLSTQRPSVNVITGLIKANVPSRVALQVASQIDSRTILDQAGAEKLLGAGDMLYLSGDMGKPVRLQSAFISETEVKKVVDYIAQHNEAEIPIDIGAPAPGTSGISLESSGSSGGGFGDDEDIDDDMYEAARAAVLEAGKASTSYLQRKLRVGYARAARLIDILEERGVIGPGDGAKPREILGGAPKPASAADAPPSEPEA